MLTDALDFVITLVPPSLLAPLAMVTSWPTCESLVKSIVTLPALPWRVFLSKRSWPVGSAASASGAPAAGAAVPPVEGDALGRAFGGAAASVAPLASGFSVEAVPIAVPIAAAASPTLI